MPRASRIPTEVEAAVLALAFERPALGRARVAAELCRRGLDVSSSSVRTIWARHGLENESKRISASAGCFTTDNNAAIPSESPATAAPVRGQTSDSFALATMAFATLGAETSHAAAEPFAAEQGAAFNFQESVHSGTHDSPRAIDRESNWLRDFLL